MADAVCPADDALSASCVLLPVVCEPHAERRMHAQVMSAVILLIFNDYFAVGNGSVSFLPAHPGSYARSFFRISVISQILYRHRQQSGKCISRFAGGSYVFCAQK